MKKLLLGLILLTSTSVFAEWSDKTNVQIATWMSVSATTGMQFSYDDAKEISIKANTPLSSEQFLLVFSNMLRNYSTEYKENSSHVEYSNTVKTIFSSGGSFEQLADSINYHLTISE
jgi:hypothetical protein